MKKLLLISTILALSFLTVGCDSIDKIFDSKVVITGDDISIVTSGDTTPKPTSSDTTVAAPTQVAVVTAPAQSGVRIVGYWENTTERHDERKPWTDQWVSIIKKDLPVYSKASDISRICPNFKNLNDDLKVKGILEFWIAVAYYESGFNPKSSAVDVGNKNDRNSYSDGLYQLSGNDGAAKFYGYNYVALLKPIENINTAGEQMRRQLKNENKLILLNSSKYRYWAVILDGNKYSQVPNVLARVKKYAPKCG